MASVVEICNRGLQKIGAKRITSLSEESVNARACNVAYAVLRDAELRDHTWSFAVRRIILAADPTPPEFGRANAFTLPSDFIRLLAPDPERNFNTLDWQIEGNKIVTNDRAPLEVRYVAQIVDPNLMDVLFRETLSARIAYEVAEELTQSNAKKNAALDDYTFCIRKAKKTNAIERVALETPEDTWISVRR